MLASCGPQCGSDEKRRQPHRYGSYLRSTGALIRLFHQEEDDTYRDVQSSAERRFHDGRMELCALQLVLPLGGVLQEPGEEVNGLTRSVPARGTRPGAGNLHKTDLPG